MACKGRLRTGLAEIGAAANDGVKPLRSGREAARTDLHAGQLKAAAAKRRQNRRMRADGSNRHAHLVPAGLAQRRFQHVETKVLAHVGKRLDRTRLELRLGVGVQGRHDIGRERGLQHQTRKHRADRVHGKIKVELLLHLNPRITSAKCAGSSCAFSRIERTKHSTKPANSRGWASTKSRRPTRTSSLIS